MNAGPEAAGVAVGAQPNQIILNQGLVVWVPAPGLPDNTNVTFTFTVTDPQAASNQGTAGTGSSSSSLSIVVNVGSANAVRNGFSVSADVNHAPDIFSVRTVQGQLGVSSATIPTSAAAASSVR
jgi:hypothetical protein